MERVDVSDSVVCLDMNVSYHEAVGRLLYLAKSTCPDIAHIVSNAAQAVQNSTGKDWY